VVPVTGPSVVEVMQGAQNVLRQHGWAKGDFAGLRRRNGRQPLDVLGALNFGAWRAPTTTPSGVVLDAALLMLAALGEPTDNVMQLAHWNDMQASVDDVIAGLALAIEYAESRGVAA
jgi:hypothetical protein